MWFQHLEKLGGGPVQANLGGASLETFSGEAQLKKSPSTFLTTSPACSQPPARPALEFTNDPFRDLVPNRWPLQVHWQHLYKIPRPASLIAVVFFCKSFFLAYVLSVDTFQLSSNAKSYIEFLCQDIYGILQNTLLLLYWEKNNICNQPKYESPIWVYRYLHHARDPNSTPDQFNLNI